MPQPQFREKQEPDLPSLYSSHRFIQLGEHNYPVVSLGDFNVLRKENLVIELVKEEHSIPLEIDNVKDDFLEFKKRQHRQNTGVDPVLFDGPVTRLENYRFENNKIYLSLQKSSFYQSYLTNFSPEVVLPDNTKSIRELYAPGPKLPDFSTSLLGNSIGVNSIVITSDNYIILQRRSGKTAVGKGIHHSVSGNMKFISSHLNNGKPDPYLSIKQTLLEELGIEDEAINSIELIGLARMVRYLGKINFFFITRLNYSRKELEYVLNSFDEHISDSWEIDNLFYIKLFGVAHSDRKSILKILNKYQFANTSYTAAQLFFYLNFTS